MVVVQGRGVEGPPWPSFIGAMPKPELSQWLTKALRGDLYTSEPLRSPAWKSVSKRYEPAQQAPAATYEQPAEPECIIEAHEKNLRIGQSLLSNMLGGAALIRCEFDAHVYANGTDMETQAIEFSIFAGQDNSIEFLVGVSREEAERQLHKLDNELQRWGWHRVQPSGPYWYSVRYKIDQEGLVRYLKGIKLLK